MEKHYDVGIVGVWFGFNYGSLLNGYATYRLLKDMGKSVLMINKPNATEDDGELQNSHCKRFINNFYDSNHISPPLPYERMHELNNYCDTFLVGSDQIWHYNITKGFNFSMMLNFVDDEKKKISFGTSFGHNRDFTPDDVKPKVKDLLKRFNAISMREQSGVDICRNIYGVKATATLEPVFCLNVEQYREIADHSNINENEPYILSYILDPSPEKIRAIEYYCSVTGMKSINILDGNPAQYKKSRTIFNLPNTLEDVGPEELIHLSLNASFIITDSFHGTCFAIMFNKPFLSIANRRRGVVRFHELAEKFGISARIAADETNIPLDKKFLEQTDFTNANKIISEERVIAIEWLRKAVCTPKQEMPSVILPENVSAALYQRECTGCGACVDVCPFSAVKMKPNQQGFINPVVDVKLCTNCGLCTKKCINTKPIYDNNSNPKCYAMMANDEIRKVSSSGGMFTVAAEYILKSGGYVCGAAYKENFEVQHIIISDLKDLPKLRGSKYIQSNTENIYSQIKECLGSGKPVLFTGMPCQVAGLYSYLGKDYENLYTIDLLCHGITSSKVFEKYRQDVLGGKTLTDLQFKAKKPWGWHAGVNADFTDGSHYSKIIEIDPYFVAYISCISKNTSCGVCKFNKLPRQGDLTIGDFWRVANFNPALNDDKGTSVVLINNNKGIALFEVLKDSMPVVEEVPLKYAIDGNHIIEHPYPLYKTRNKFFELLDNIPFDSLTTACKNNRVYEQIYTNLLKTVLKEDIEYYYIAKFVAENYNGRKIVTWIRSEKFERVLKKYFGLSVAFGVAMTKGAVKPGYVEDFSVLNKRSGEFYIVSLDRAYDDEAYKKLAFFGYKEKKDFVFRRFKPIVLENLDLSKENYYDSYGNSIEGFYAVIGRVIIRGFNNHIMLGKNIPTAKNLSFDLGANSVIDIGENTRFGGVGKIEIKGYDHSAALFIGKNCNFNESLFRFYSHDADAYIRINDNVTSSSHFELHANQGKRIIIGRDCMFSFENELWAGDGHTIFDTATGENKNGNFGKKFSPNNQLVIGEHVWVGKQAFVMHGTNVGDGSIIGARSFVKGTFPNNCSIGGNPAKKIKDNIAWSRDGMSTDINSCGKPEYAALSSNSKPSISGCKVLVIGGTRFMGIQLVNELINRGNDVTIATRGKTKDNFGIWVDRIVMDVTNSDSVKKALQDKYFDVVFDNLAYSSRNANNILSNIKCKKYIQLSSVEAYDKLHIDMKEKDFNPYIMPFEIKDMSDGYIKGKRRAEAIAYQKFNHLPVVTVRIPYITKTDRLYYYCAHIVKQIPMNITDVSHGFTFLRDTEVGKFLPWIAGQNFTGPINLASEGMITIKSILDYIEVKTGKKAIIDTVKGDKSPFHEFNENTFSMNMDKAKHLGWQTSNINDWFWKLMDEYIARALKEK